MGLPISEDAELRELFRGEVVERAAALTEGARAFAAGEAPEGLAHDLYREGHTIKGTGRMMGFIAISTAGKLLEDTWRKIDEGELSVEPGLAERLGVIGSELVAAVDADPDVGTPALTAAVAATQAYLDGGDEPEPPAAPVVQPEPDSSPTVETADLGGLLGAIDDWAFGENVRVNASNLFSFINGISALRVETEALTESATAVREAVGNPTLLRSTSTN